MSINTCTFVGNLGANPEITTLPSGKERTRFSVAVRRNYKAKDSGEAPVDWIPVVIWGSAEYMRKTHLGKGDKVVVTGRMEMHEWTDSNGLPQRAVALNCTNIELVAKKRSIKDDAVNSADASAQQGTFEAHGEEEDLPF